MKNEQKVSPLKHSPLRQAGQYLDEKIADTADDWTALFTTLLAIIFSCLTIWLEYFYGGVILPMFISVIGLVGIIYVVRKFYIAKAVIQDYSLGSEGEKYVSGFLATHVYEGYIFNDFQVFAGDKKFNIDHILISPKGVFAIETKTWKRDISGVDNVYKNEWVKKAIYQAEGEAKKLCDLINFSTIQPVVLFTERFVQPNTSTEDVWVLNEKYFTKKINDLPDLLSRAEIDKFRDILYSLQSNNKEIAV